MNIIEINKILDLEYVLNSPLLITHKLLLQNEEALNNTWGISLSRAFYKNGSEIIFIKFLEKLLKKR